MFHFFSVYGNLERLKFFWSYLNDKNAPFELVQNCVQVVGHPFIDNQMIFTPLHFVAHQGDAKVAKFMINNIDPDDPIWSEKCMNVKYGYTPLHVAAYTGRSLECVKILTKQFNPNPFFPYKELSIPFYEANKSCTCSEDICQYLMQFLFKPWVPTVLTAFGAWKCKLKN